MYFKSISIIILAIVTGILFGKVSVIFGNEALAMAKGTYKKIESVEISDFISNISFSRTITVVNDVDDKEEGGDFSTKEEKQDESSIFVNPAKMLKENFPKVDTASGSDRRQFSEDLTIPNSGKVLVANLESMEIDLYEEGEIVSSHKILSKGRPGTAWETPPGSFEIKYKTENHFSSIGKVWMPFSMQFFGNYFIHGWPHYSDGSQVAEGYSGGCIRLSDADAQDIYNFSEVTTPVIVLGTTEESMSILQNGHYEISNKKLPNNITSRSYIVADLDSGDILFSKDSNTEIPIASITKLMTALISLETINQYNNTNISKSAYDTEGWRGDLEIGESILTGDLIFPLLLQSSNDAAEALAEVVGRNSFINNMNARVKSLDLKQTKFSDPSGLSKLNVSSAFDLYKLAKYIFKYKKYIFEVTQLPKYANDNHSWPNTSHFVGDEYFLGGKNGFTDEARHTLMTLVDLPIKIVKDDTGKGTRDKAETSEYINRRFAIIVLNAEKTLADTKIFINYLKDNVKYITN